MKKILFPTDFSDTTNNAFLYALDMSKKLSAELLVLHVYTSPILVGGVAPTVIDQVSKEASVEATKEFESKTEELRKVAQEQHLDKIQLSFILKEGSLYPHIEDLIRTEGIDLLIMGTTGNSSFDNKIFGSKTVNMIKNMEIPILSIPTQAKFSGINKIAFTTSFDQQDDLALDKLLLIATVYNAEVTALYVDNGKNQMDESKLQVSIDHYTSKGVSMATIEETDIAEGIIRLVESERPDIVCAVRKDKSFLQRIFESSMTSNMSYQLDIPLLVFHEE